MRLDTSFIQRKRELQLRADVHREHGFYVAAAEANLIGGRSHGPTGPERKQLYRNLCPDARISSSLRRATCVVGSVHHNGLCGCCRNQNSHAQDAKGFYTLVTHCSISFANSSTRFRPFCLAR